MEAIALVFSKFSEELIAAQLALLLVCTGTALYLLLVRKKKKESAEWVPAAVVRAYLDRVQAEEREVRMKLFGELSATYGIPNPMTAPLATALGTTIADPNLVRELEALRAQLALSDQRVIEFDRNMNALKAEKAALEQKLKELGSGVAATGAASGSPEFVALQKEASDLKEKLQEYSVIEDDLANLKKFQKENEQLRQRIGQLEGGAASSTVVSGSPAAPEAKAVISGVTEVKNSASMVLVSGGSATQTAAAPVSAPAAAPASPSVSPEQNTNVLQPVTPVADVGAAVAPAAAPAADPAAAAPAATAEKSSKQKEEELLSEFEKMLAS